MPTTATPSQRLVFITRLPHCEVNPAGTPKDAPAPTPYPAAVDPFPLRPTRPIVATSTIPAFDAVEGHVPHPFAHPAFRDDVPTTPHIRRPTYIKATLTSPSAATSCQPIVVMAFTPRPSAGCPPDT